MILGAISLDLFATLLGGARAPLALGMLREATGQSYSFLEWALANIPLVAAMLVIGFFVISFFFPTDITSIREADDLRVVAFAFAGPCPRSRSPRHPRLRCGS